LWSSPGKQEDEQAHYITFLSNDDDTKPPHLRDYSENLAGRIFPPIKFGENNYTPTSLSYLKGLAFLKKHVDASIIKNVIEIGGGYGNLGEILLKSTPEQIFYVNVDIPPISAVATYYLQTVFGKEAILDYSQSAEMEILDIEEIRKKYKGMVICPWQLPKIKGNFELSVNYVSFQEMEPEVVKNYVTYLNALTSNYVLMRNSRYGKQIASQPYTFGVIKQTTREDYLNFFSDFNLVALDCKTFGYFSPPNFESEVMLLERKKKEANA
jgi:putative sugar O-methyltransferase